MAKGRGRRRKHAKAKAVKAPTSPIALAVPDHYGNTVTISEETVLHAAKHGVRADLDEIGKTIQTPMRIRSSEVSYETNAFCFERMTDTTSEHIRVPVHYPPDADVAAGTAVGQAKTYYPVDYTSPSGVGPVIYEAPDSTLPDQEISK